jgi:hypothetical protein
MPQYDGIDDDHNAIAFFVADHDRDQEAAEMDFSPADYGSGDDEPDFSPATAYAPDEPAEAATELDAIRAQISPTEDGEEEEQDGVDLFTVTNPRGTVSVSALMDGRVCELELSPEVASMSESQLADEILVLARLARQKGLAGQHTFLGGLTKALGAEDNEEIVSFFGASLDLPSTEEAEAAQAEVFAARYATDI